VAMPKAPAKVDPAKEAAKAAAKVEKACNDLGKACKDDALSKAKKSVEAGAELDFDVTGTGSTPMHVAAGFGSYEVVKYLFSVGGLPSLEKKNAKEKTPLDVAMQVGEDKIVRLLKALLRGEPPPQEAAGDDDDDDDDDEAYPVNETSTGAKATGQAAPPLKAVDPEAVEAKAAEVVQVAELVTKLQSLSFSTAGKLGISLEKNVVAKVGEAGTQAADKGVKPGWVLFSIGGTEVEADKAAIMKQAAAALKLTPAGVDFCFQVPPAAAPSAAVEID